MARPAAEGTTIESPLVERNSRPTRWFHAGVYAATFVLIMTGLWLTLGREGRSSPLARLMSTNDVALHKVVGWALAVLAVAGALIGWRATRTFILDSLRYRRADLEWLRSWPGAVFTGRFGSHLGHFDPGQRIANIVLAGGLSIVVGSGLGLVWVHGGDTFVWLLRVHKWGTFLLLPVIAGHIVIGLGILPGYRGVWGAMHYPGRIPRSVADRLWPGERTPPATGTSRSADLSRRRSRRERPPG